MDIDFPRGDILNENIGKKKNRKRKLNKENNDDVAPDKAKKFLKSKYDLVWTNRLNLDLISTNLLVLGCVKSCSESEIRLELIDGLNAIVPINAISNRFLENLKQLDAGKQHETARKLDKMFNRGQLLVIKVTSMKTASNAKSSKGQIVVGTTDPQEVNVNLLLNRLQIGQVVMASVKSVEDKGFQMDIGSKSTFGFLPFNDCLVHPSNASIGQVMLCTVAESSAPDKRLLKLTAKTPSVLSQVPAREQLLPGVLLKGNVEKIIGGGCYVKFSDHLTGFVPKSKLNERFESTKTFENCAEVTCIVTFQSANTNMIGFSCQNYLFNHSNCSDRVSFNELRVGDKCKGVVKTIGSKNGIYFELIENESDIVAFVPANELQCENDVDKIKTKYIVASEHDLRITGLSLMNRLLYATNKKSRLNQPFMTIEDAVPGTVLKAVVEKTIEAGVFVKVCDSMHGFIPKIHSADVPFKDLDKHFTAGQTVKVRVLCGDTDRHRLLLTAKKSLIKSQSPIVASYESSLHGVVSDGVVVKVSQSGVLVTFYGSSVKGWLSRTELESADCKEDPQKYFHLGQVVRVKITSIDREQRKMSLAPAFSNISLSSVVEKRIPDTFSSSSSFVPRAKVVKVTENGLDVVFGDDGHSRGHLPAYHLSDSVSDLDLLSSTFKSGDTVGPCVIFAKGTQFTLSTKPSIVEAIENKRVPETFDQLEEGKFVVGVVSKIHPELGYFVDLPGKILQTLAPFSAVDKGAHQLVVGQTVVGLIQRVDVEKRRFRLNLSLNSCLIDGTQLSVQLLKKYFVERQKIVENFCESNDDLLCYLARGIQVGQIVKCIVTKVTTVGLICTLQNGLKGVITVEHLGKSPENFKENDEINAFVLHVDFKDVCLELSLLPNVMKKLKKSLLETTTTKMPDVNQRLRANVLLVKKDFIVVFLDVNVSGMIAYMPARLHYNDVLEYGRYKTGDRLAVVVKEIYNGCTLVSNIKNEKVYGDKVSPLKKHVDEATTPLQKWVTVEIGKIYDGHVLQIDNFYVDIFIKKSQKARIHVSELSDTFVDGACPLNSMLPNRDVRTKVIGFIKCSNGTRAAECTLRKSKFDTISNKKKMIYYKQTFKKGEKVNVFIDHFKGETCHVEINPEWKGFISIHDMSVDEHFLEHPETHFSKGQVYSAFILSVQAKEKRLYLSLLSSKKRSKSKCFKAEIDDVATPIGSKRRRTTTESSLGSLASETDSVRMNKQTKTDPMNTELPRLKVDAGFNWMSDRFSMKNLMEVGLEIKKNIKLEDEVSIKNECRQTGDENASSDIEEIDAKTSKETKNVVKSKFERDKIEERQLIQKELSLLDPERNLDTAEDFDRLLMGSPDSSLLWLRYMAMYLQTAEISKARAVAERALKTISLREENEKFNIWTAMLNMENAYGTKDTLNEVFERAKQVNEPLKVYRQLLKIFQRSNKMQEADDLIDEMLKKFKSEFDLWILAGEHFYATQPPREEKSRELMQRSLKSLPEHQQIDVVSRYAQMEFKYADSERGRTLFENLLNEYPKRTDIWSVYIDMTCKHRSADEARVLFERVTSLKLPVHKLKSFYKKWTDFETRHGNDETRRQANERYSAMFKNNENDVEKE